jgi:UTP:GlnB (protein PII) uridylyltransferase
VAALDIHRSKIATEANRAIDVFYVRDKASMQKITDPARQNSLRESLLALLAAVDAPKLSVGG